MSKSDKEQTATLPLSGIRVLDLTHVAAGPFCGSLLGQLGATVIKVEPIGDGELMRKAAPFIGNGGMSFYFACVNTEKEYIQIDLKSDHGRQVFFDLAKQSDVVIQNMAPGVVKRLGIDYDSIQKLKDDIIYCSISGFRLGSAYQDLPSFDYIHEAMSGVMSMTGIPGEPPPLPGLPAADMSASVYSVLSILLALRVRDTTGVGQNIEVPLHDCLLSLLPARIGFTYATGKPFPTFGAYHRDFAPFGVFRTKDSQLVITVGSENLWSRFLICFPDLDLPKYSTQRKRLDNLDELYGNLRHRFSEQTTEEWLNLFRKNGVPAAPIMDTSEVVADPYVKERSQTLKVDGGEYTWQRFPVKFSSIQPRLQRAPEAPGTDTRTVLRRLGYSDEKIESLILEAAIAASGTSK